MTYCGATSGASNLTMENVPYHEEVKKFGEDLCAARLKQQGGGRGRGAHRGHAGRGGVRPRV